MTPPDLAVVDVETTGFAFKSHDRIVEVAVVRTDFEGHEVTRFETLVNPRRDVGPTHIHGITAEMVKDAPPFEDLADVILEVLEGTRWVAHNARFDVNFLAAELARAGTRVESVPYHCTLQSARRVFPDLPSHKLERICEALDIELARTHSALSDARATRDLLDLLRNERPDLIPRSREAFRPPRKRRRSGAEPVTRRQMETARDREASRLEGLLARLPSVETDHEAVAAYADLLDDVVTEAEREDLEKVQRMLGLGDRDLDALIEEIRRDLGSTYSGGREGVDPQLRGKSVCFTGSLTARIDGESVSRKTAQRLADERGMVVKTGVTKKLDYLVAADPHTQSNKGKKARRYGIPIVAEIEFWRRLGVEVE